MLGRVVIVNDEGGLFAEIETRLQRVLLASGMCHLIALQGPACYLRDAFEFDNLARCGFTLKQTPLEHLIRNQ